MEDYRFLHYKVKRSSQKEFDDLKELIAKHPASFRRVNPSDSFSIGVPVLVIHSTGKGNRDRYLNAFEFANADFGIVGKRYADAYIYRSLDADQHGYAKRFNVEYDQILICL